MARPKNSSTRVPGTRLESLRVLAKIADVNNRELIAASGKTPVSLYKWYRDDDIKMSNLALLAQRCGYVVYAGLSKSSVVDRELMTIVTPLKPLQFIARSLEYYGYTRESAAEKAGIPIGTFNGWMYKQQCTMADIISLGSKLGMSMFLEYRKMHSLNDAPRGGGLHATIDGLDFYSE